MIEERSYIDNLKNRLDEIEGLMISLLDGLTINKQIEGGVRKIKPVREGDQPGLSISPKYSWGAMSEQQQQIQIALKDHYSSWRKHFNILLKNAPRSIVEKVRRTDISINRWIEFSHFYDVPSSIESAKYIFSNTIKDYSELLNLYIESGSGRAILVPDTNAMIIAPDFSAYARILNNNSYEVQITPTVLEELDNLKNNTHKDQDFRDKVRSVIRRIKGLRKQGQLSKGVTVNKTIIVKLIAKNPDFSETLDWLDSEVKDDCIVASTLEIQTENPSSIVVLVTNDINLQNKAEAALIPYHEPPK